MTDTATVYAVTDPTTGEVLTTFPTITDDELRAAIDTADRAHRADRLQDVRLGVVDDLVGTSSPDRVGAARAGGRDDVHAEALRELDRV
ncbi:hypothetical protein IAE22_30810, partial [Bacillus sp. S34]|nr:hypothetical protein [Bacillus sp. S34]